MAKTQSIRVGDIGTWLEVQVMDNCAVVDISAAIAKTITIKRPDGTSVVKDGIFSTDGTDGKVYFITEDTDITIAGTYRIQAFISLAVWIGYSSIEEFTVEGNL